MSRPARQLNPNCCYHIITRGNNRHVVFNNDSDYLYFLYLIKKFKREHPFDLFHYCIMSNHVHMLVKTYKDSDFSKFMKRLNLAYFYHYRKYNDWIGHFWQDRFISKPVEKDSYFIQCGKYIELNPVRVGLVNLPEEYPYSSYRHYGKGKPDVIITNDFIYSSLGLTNNERQQAYRKIVITEIAVSSLKKKGTVPFSNSF